MADLIKDPQTGEWFEQRGGRLIPYSGMTPDDISRAQQVAQEGGAWQAAGMNIINALGGGYLVPRLTGITPGQYQADIAAMQQQHPIASAAGQIGAMLPGVIAAGASIPAQILAGGLQGAIGNANDPLAAAAEGGAFGAAGGVAGKLMTAAGRSALKASFDSILTRGGELLPTSPGLGRVAGIADVSGFTSMADRVTGNISRAAGRTGGGQGGAIPYILNIEEARALGIPLNYGDELLLGAKDLDTLAHANRVRNAETLRSTTMTGADISAVRQAQKDTLTGIVKRELGLSPETTLSTGEIGAAFERVGAKFNQLASDIGEVALPADAPQVFGEIIKQSTGSYKGLIKNIIKRINAEADLGGGAISGSTWGEIRHELTQTIQAGANQGDKAKMSAAGQILEYMTNALEGSLPEAAKAEAKTARRQYRILKTLSSSSGVVDPYGNVNAATFANKWIGRNPSGYKGAMEDPLSRVAVTLKALQDKITPSSGTAERLLANPVGSGVKGALALGALGYGKTLFE